MAIGRIGSSGIYGNYYDYSAINRYRLQQSLNERSVSPVSKISKVKQVTSQVTDSVDFLKKYNTSMSDLMSDANKLRSNNSTGVLNERTVSSSDSSVLTAEKKFNLGTSMDNYSVDVQQLAAAQSNVSSAVDSKELAVSDANFNIITNTGNVSFQVSATNENGEQKTNKQLLQDTAKEINQNKNLGVTASVIEKDGKSSLQITAKETGEKNSFLVSGDFAQETGLTQAATSAQDAKYTIKQNDGKAKEYSSASNNISLNYGKIAATLKKTGSADISVGMDTSKVVSAVDDLVSSYNHSLKVLNDNADRGTGVTRQLSNVLRGIGSEKSMELVGISVNKDGTLALDKDKLTSSLQKDPKLTKDILGGSAGLAQGAFQSARSGLTTPSSSLINNDLQNLHEERLNDPLEFMSMYSRRGSYNMMNYSAVGLMLNVLA